MTIAELDALIEKARAVKMTDDQRAKQLRSFAYGNTHIENPRISKEMIDKAESTLEKKGDKSNT